MIYKTVDPLSLRLDPRELSARMSIPVETEGEYFASGYKALCSAASPAYVIRRILIERDGDAIRIGRIKTESRALGKVIGEASECCLMVATLGVQVDRLILKRAEISPAEAFIIDALADAMAEALCDLAESEVSEAVGGRFSPGYADLELEVGAEIVALTEADKRLGIRLTESGLMVPKKSVSAIIPIKKR